MSGSDPIEVDSSGRHLAISRLRVTSAQCPEYLVDMAAPLEVPAPLTEPPVVTVASDRNTVVDGTPFFPIGIYGLDDGVLEEAAAAGFNLTHTYSRCCGEGELEFQLEFLERVAQAGLRALVYPF